MLHPKTKEKIEKIIPQFSLLYENFDKDFQSLKDSLLNPKEETESYLKWDDDNLSNAVYLYNLLSKDIDKEDLEKVDKIDAIIKQYDITSDSIITYCKELKEHPNLESIQGELELVEVFKEQLEDPKFKEYKKFQSFQILLSDLNSTNLVKDLVQSIYQLTGLNFSIFFACTIPKETLQVLVDNVETAIQLEISFAKRFSYLLDELSEEDFKKIPTNLETLMEEFKTGLE